mmetsp:Transcript_20892/g.41427  ORF Transcript_20892/g.41427 Transcript_20892/m.41427 type:complete len:201 (-) Transcript_20892:802-1404(-)
MAQTHARIPRRLSRRIPPRNPYRRPSLLPAILSSQTPHPFHLRHALPISSHGVASGQKRGGGGDFEGGGEEVRGRGGGGAAEEIGGEEGGGDEGEFLVAVLVEYFGLSSGSRPRCSQRLLLLPLLRRRHPPRTHILLLHPRNPPRRHPPLQHRPLPPSRRHRRPPPRSHRTKRTQNAPLLRRLQIHVQCLSHPSQKRRYL